MERISNRNRIAFFAILTNRHTGSIIETEPTDALLNCRSANSRQEANMGRLDSIPPAEHDSPLKKQFTLRKIRLSKGKFKPVCQVSQCYCKRSQRQHPIEPFRKNSTGNFQPRMIPYLNSNTCSPFSSRSMISPLIALPSASGRN